ncbi:MAG: hypothetical protein A2W72_15350 [Burkholderiales bacterium RIFCSPLOWO2_12_67_14]|nr:MAG: hypothetical protein A3I64_23320 [Burkholderiales bacterium RIFCSPLOWO2_02_FULL_67_64]OGB39474.1 MAG: hypothetical protein A2W72_15350 [Burkholderiales bacterium RIFCSPLOWO2_12_67_14]OGB52210.1 MAG: hypothetical protein A3E51_24750 [Burkholderiales bacterium RIFCSPHIGHO2_12_FULL_67_38]OGB97701.1 MAG: hypothetical protein A3G82_12470 [Burkholderiales bacterium RIFCSPLOWO2_12_FULL_67_210]
MAKRFPINPPHPERNCWGCDRFCAADALLCGNGSERTQHPIETFGPGWESWSGIPEEKDGDAATEAPATDAGSNG